MYKYKITDTRFRKVIQEPKERFFELGKNRRRTLNKNAQEIAVQCCSDEKLKKKKYFSDNMKYHKLAAAPLASGGSTFEGI